ncbi:MAG: acetoacetate--CoA ligase [Myxococcales bacterium]|nr:MAG: acetoacetate--CoA ligase [Myxococcales bacterium]
MSKQSQAKKPLWTPSPEYAQNSRMAKFLHFINKREKTKFSTYEDLYRWSVSSIDRFWAAIWDFGEIRFSKPYEKVVEDLSVMPGTKWFPGARLNFAENLLRYRDDREALIFRGETSRRYVMTYAELYSTVARLAAALKKMGVRKGDRVAGYVANIPETVAAMLAVTSLGAVWSSCSPDFGWTAARDRFGQIRPKVLFGVDGYFYNGKTFKRLDQLQALVREIDSIEKVVVVPFTDPNPDLSSVPKAVSYKTLLEEETAQEIEFVQTEADHPVYVLYSSGTTAVPKCITHGAVGTLLQHFKELALHTDVSRETSICYFTTCGWMMWNWMASSLMLGARIVLFDGSPFAPGPEVLWKIAEQEKLTVFGTSAKYLASLEEAGLKPKEKFDLSPLKVICSTGSPLSPESFRYVYRDIKSDVQLSSIAGGTDIVSCFMLGNPLLPVYEEEIQCIGLGMKVEALDENGKPVIGERGELVCSAPAPSMPIYFWNDPNMEKYQGAYFMAYPGKWRHGDYIVIARHGGVVMLGRSDATLNPGGVRIGTAEIYNPVGKLPEIADSLVVGQKWNNDERVVLFVKLAEGVTFDEALAKKIKDAIRTNASPRHVPAKIIPVTDIPYTRTGKKVELAVRKILNGEEVTNRSALANPNVLDIYKNIPELKDKA